MKRTCPSWGGVEVVGTFHSAQEAFLTIQSSHIDIVFLDIEMPGISGLQLVKTLKYKPHIIITTAYRDYAIEGYELDVTDYLLKPISFERLATAVSKVLHNRPGGTFETIVPPDNQQEPTFIYVKSEREHVKIELEEILYIESLKNHVRIMTESGPVITLVSISKMVDRLPDDRFVRIHKTHIVSIKAIEKYSQTNVTIKGKTLAIGRYYKNNVLSLLDRYSI